MNGKFEIRVYPKIRYKYRLIDNLFETVPFFNRHKNENTPIITNISDNL